MQRVTVKVVVSITMCAFVGGLLTQPLAAARDKVGPSSRVAIEWVGLKLSETEKRFVKGRWIARSGASRTTVAAAAENPDYLLLIEQVSKLRAKHRVFGDRLSTFIRLHEYSTVAPSDRRSILDSLGISIDRVVTGGTIESTFSVRGNVRARVSGPTVLRARLKSQMPDGAEAVARDEIDEQPILEAETEFEDAVAYTIAVEDSSEAEAVYWEGQDWGSEADCAPATGGPSAPESTGDSNCVTEGFATVGLLLEGAYVAKLARDAIIAAKNTMAVAIDAAYTSFYNGAITAAAANSMIAGAVTAFRSASNWQIIGIAGAVIAAGVAATILGTCIYRLIAGQPADQNAHAASGFVARATPAHWSHAAILGSLEWYSSRP